MSGIVIGQGIHVVFSGGSGGKNSAEVRVYAMICDRKSVQPPVPPCFCAGRAADGKWSGKIEPSRSSIGLFLSFRRPYVACMSERFRTRGDRLPRAAAPGCDPERAG
jgi:hypothetical protein